MPAARASGITSGDPTCPTATLGEYVASFGGSSGCNLGNVTVFNFYDAQLVGSVLAPNALDDIMVTPDVANDALNFSGFNTVIGISDAEQMFTLDYTSDPAPIEIGQTLSLDPPVGVTLTQYYCGNGLFQSGSYFVAGMNPTCSGTYQGMNTVTPGNPMNTFMFPNAPLSQVDMQTVIDVDPAGTFDASDMMTIATPEPATLSLAGLAFLGVYALRRRRSRLVSDARA